jgi:hypothetical protein
MRPQVIVAGGRSVKAATVADFHDLSEFQRDVIISAREMGHSISEVVMCWGFFPTTILRVLRENRESGITSNLRHCRHCCGRKKTCKNGKNDD